MAKAKNLNMTERPLFFGMIRFAIPLILTSVLQIVYNMADSIVVGKFSGDYNALGAVGSAGALTTLITNVMISLSAGAGVVIAQLYGAKDEKEVSRTAHTSMGISVIGGILMMIIGFIISRPVLDAMGTLPVYIDKAVLYMQIICIGIPASAVYNFGASILRASGDSKTSLYILSASGLINIVLNFILVVFFNMAVAGVAISTVISQYMSAVAVIFVLMKRKNESYCISLKKIRVEKRILKRVLRIGLPMTFQSLLFSLSGVIISTSVNTFTPVVVEAKTIAFSIESITATILTAFANTAITFVGQNYGAKKFSRINKIFLLALIQVTAAGILVSQIEIFFGRELSMLYIDKTNPDGAAIVDAVMEIFKIMLAPYFLCGVMEVVSGVLKALGYTVRSMIGSLIGLAVRILWVILIVPIPKFHTIPGLFVSYLLAWGVTIAVDLIFCAEVWRKLGIFKLAKAEKEICKI